MTGAAASFRTEERVGAAASHFHFLETNLESLPMSQETRELVRESEPKGSVELLGDGTPYLRVGSNRLGMPLSSSEVFTQLHDIQDHHVVVVFGLGSGQIAHAARAMCNVPIVVYEPDPGLLRTMLDYGPLDLGNIPIACGISDLMRVWLEFAARLVDVRVLTTPGYYSAYPEEVRAFVEVIPSLLQRTAISKATFQNRARAWILDIIDNVELLMESPPFLALRGHYRGVPGFIIGAGPSLDKNIGLLAEAARKGIVFATNSGAVSLAKHGIEPQVIACIESIDASSKLRDLPFISRSVRAFSLTAAPATLRCGAGPLLPVHELVAQYDSALHDLYGQPGLPVSGSVSTMAFSLARLLGCSPIVLVGQDLAYTNGRTYANGTGYESSAAEVSEKTGVIRLRWNEEALRVHGSEQGPARDQEELKRLPAWGGEGEVDSAVSFSNMRDWFQRTAELLEKASSDVRLVNATEGGVHIPGYEDIPLARVLSELPEHEVSPEQIARDARAAWTPLTRAQITEWLEAHAETCRGVRNAARRIRRYAQHAARVTLTGNPRLVRPAYERLEQAEAGLKSAVLACPFVDAWSHRAVDEALLSAVEPSESAVTGPHSEARDATHRSARLAGAIEQSARDLESALRRGAARMTGLSTL